VANSELKTTNPIRLGLALNFSVFYYEVLNDAAKACQLAKSVLIEINLRLSMMPSLILNKSKKINTRTQQQLCNSSEITSHYGHLNLKMKVVMLKTSEEDDILYKYI
jgi:hypothetical protein